MAKPKSGNVSLSIRLPKRVVEVLEDTRWEWRMERNEIIEHCIRETLDIPDVGSENQPELPEG